MGLLQQGAGGDKADKDHHRMMADDPLEKFCRANVTEAELREVLDRLGPIKEPASFWSAIANDRSMPMTNRKLALVQLVRRHVVPGTTTVGAFARMLDGPRWLGDDKVTAFTAIAGKVPVSWSLDDTVIALALPGDSCAIYLTIGGTFAAEAVVAALRGTTLDARILSAVIRDAGFELSG